MYYDFGGWYINSLLIKFFSPNVFIKNFAIFFENDDSVKISISSSSSSSSKLSYVKVILFSVILKYSSYSISSIWLIVEKLIVYNSEIENIIIIIK